MSKSKPPNPFEVLEQHQQPPVHIKRKVMTSVKFSYIMGHILDLFISKPIVTIGVLFKTRPKDNQL